MCVYNSQQSNLRFCIITSILIACVQILMLLDPDQKQSRDVMTYFQPQQKGEGSSSEGEGGGGGLAELPVEGLKRRHRGGVASTEQGRGRGRLTRRKAGGEKK